MSLFKMRDYVKEITNKFFEIETYEKYIYYHAPGETIFYKVVDMIRSDERLKQYFTVLRDERDIEFKVCSKNNLQDIRFIRSMGQDNQNYKNKDSVPWKSNDKFKSLQAKMMNAPNTETLKEKMGASKEPFLINREKKPQQSTPNTPDESFQTNAEIDRNERETNLALSKLANDIEQMDPMNQEFFSYVILPMMEVSDANNVFVEEWRKESTLQQVCENISQMNKRWYLGEYQNPFVKMIKDSESRQTQELNKVQKQMDDLCIQKKQEEEEMEL
jgi:hypothetical protein